MTRSARVEGLAPVAGALASAALGLTITLIAMIFDSSALFVPGIGLLALGLGAWAWVDLAARGAWVARTLGPPTVSESEPYPMRVEMAAGVLPAPGGELTEPLLGRPLAIAGRKARRARVNVTFERRGRRTLEPCRLVIADPLGLARRELRSDPGEVVVMPRIEAVRAAGQGDLGDSDGGLARAGIAAELELDSLRPYREGAPASRIHWPTLARTQTLMERRLVAEADAHPLVVLDPRGATLDDDLDSAVRAAASLCFYLAGAGGCGLLLPGERRPVEVAADRRAWPALHVRLALVDAEQGAPALGRLDRGGAIFWVSANHAGRTPATLARAGGVRFLITPGAGTAAAAFTVAGCTARRLGSGRARAAA